jgi:hypothetical protein
MSSLSFTMRAAARSRVSTGGAITLCPVSIYTTTLWFCSLVIPLRKMRVESPPEWSQRELNVFYGSSPPLQKSFSSSMLLPMLLLMCTGAVLGAPAEALCESHHGAHYVPVDFKNASRQVIPERCTTMDLAYNDLTPEHAKAVAEGLQASKVGIT